MSSKQANKFAFTDDRASAVSAVDGRKKRAGRGCFPLRAVPSFEVTSCRIQRGLLGHAHCARLTRVGNRSKDCCKNQFNDETGHDIHDNFCDQTPKHLHSPLHVHDKNDKYSLKPTSQATVGLLPDLLLLFYSANVKRLLSRCYILWHGSNELDSLMCVPAL
jgi:hypothetical protein